MSPLTQAQRYAKQVSAANRRARDAGLVGTLTTQEWRETLAHFYKTCAFCTKSLTSSSKSYAPHVALINGYSIKSNALPACRACHREYTGKGARDLDGLGPIATKRLRAFFDTHGAPA